MLFTLLGLLEGHHRLPMGAHKGLVMLTYVAFFVGSLDKLVNE